MRLAMFLVVTLDLVAEASQGILTGVAPSLGPTVGDGGSVNVPVYTVPSSSNVGAAGAKKKKKGEQPS